MWPDEVLNDPELRMRCYHTALAEWSCDAWNTVKPVAMDWLRKEIGHYTLRGLFELLHDHVKKDPRNVREVRETRPDYRHHEFHFDLILVLDGRAVYFETILVFGESRPPYDPRIEVVSIHDAT
jgi:hypothetical protein